MPIRFSYLDSKKQSEPLPKESRIENPSLSEKRVHKICTAASPLVETTPDEYKKIWKGVAQDVHDNVYTANFFTYKVFFRVISRLIASFVGASVIGHGILAEKYLAEYRDLLNSSSLM